MITLEAFADGLDRFGGALRNWPPVERRDAEALLTGSPCARALHAAMGEVEAALALSTLEDGNVERFAATATRRRQERPDASWIARAAIAKRAGWGAAVAAALVLGMLVGNLDLGAHDDNPAQLLASALGTASGAVDVD